MQRTVWLAISYNVPIKPSKARVYVWRKLKEIGAEYFKQGVALLPNTAQSMQQFTALAQKIRQMGGEASIVELRFTDPADELQMTARFKKQVDDEYTELLADCAITALETRNPCGVKRRPRISDTTSPSGIRRAFSCSARAS